MDSGTFDAFAASYAKDWLLENKDATEASAEWNNVFDVYWYAVYRRTLFAVTMVSKLRIDDASTDGETKSSIERGANVARRLLTADQQFAHQIHRAALNNGTLWHIGDDRTIYKRTGVINNQDGWETVSRGADDLLKSDG